MGQNGWGKRVAACLAAAGLVLSLNGGAASAAGNTQMVGSAEVLRRFNADGTPSQVFLKLTLAGFYGGKTAATNEWNCSAPWLDPQPNGDFAGDGGCETDYYGFPQYHAGIPRSPVPARLNLHEEPGSMTITGTAGAGQLMCSGPDLTERVNNDRTAYVVCQLTS